MELTEEEEFIIKWQYRILGDFTTALIDAIKRADSSNLARLALGFPMEVKAYKLYAEQPGWWQRTEEKYSELRGER